MRLTEDAEGHEEQQQVEREFGHGRTRGSTRAQKSAADQNFSSSSSGAETGSGRHHCTDCESGSGGAEQHLRAAEPPPRASAASTPARSRPPATRSPRSVCLSKVAKYYYYCFFYDLTGELFSPCFDSRARPNNFLRRQEIVKQIWCASHKSKHTRAATLLSCCRFFLSPP